MARDVLALASLLRAQAPPGSRVGLVLGDPYSFAIALFSTWYLGCTAVPIAAPSAFQQRSSYQQYVRPLLEHAAASLTICERETLPLLEHVNGGVFCYPDRLPRSHQLVSGALPTIALLQYTSGSTGTPKAAVITTRSLIAQTGMIRATLELGDDDCVASWLPTHHDLGLVGAWITPIVFQISTMITSPREFVRSPNEWIEAMVNAGGTISGSPPIGYELLLRRLQRSERLDLSRWRVAICGSEPVDPYLLRSATRRLEDFGFKREAFLVGYGMAETTLAVSATPLPERVKVAVLRLDGDEGEALESISSSAFDELEDPESSSRYVTSCGRPLPGVSIQIVDETGVSVECGELGEIVVTSPSVFSGYLDEQVVEKTLRTGDVGFLMDDELYVGLRQGVRTTIFVSIQLSI